MTSAGPLPGAAELLAAISAKQKEFFIVTNDASRTPESCVRVYKERGLTVSLDRVLSAGVAIGETFREKKLSGATTVVLGTFETSECVRRAGGHVVAINDAVEYDVLVIGDDSGFDFLPTMNSLLTATHRLLKKSKRPTWLLANPDLLYPRTNESFAFTSGSVAKFLEIGVRDLHPGADLNFEVLGKPSPLLFNLAMKKSKVSPSRTVMLGDQLHTDIAGANRAGIASALLTTGITQLPLATHLPAALQPTWILQSLSLAR